jgi:peptidoglycan/LPS O-acetylase OafA/YrhL
VISALHNVAFTSNLFDIVGGNPIINALFLGFMRPLWAIAIAWVVYECHRGSGGFVNEFLSSRLWKPLAKLGYCMYLVHPVVMYIFHAMEPTNYEISHMVG